MSKIKILSPSDIQAFKGTNGVVTLFLNKNTNTLCYKDSTGKIIQVGIVEKPGDEEPKGDAAARP